MINSRLHWHSYIFTRKIFLIDRSSLIKQDSVDSSPLPSNPRRVEITPVYNLSQPRSDFLNRQFPRSISGWLKELQKFINFLRICFPWPFHHQNNIVTSPSLLIRPNCIHNHIKPKFPRRQNTSFPLGPRNANCCHSHENISFLNDSLSFGISALDEIGDEDSLAYFDFLENNAAWFGETDFVHSFGEFEHFWVKFAIFVGKGCHEGVQILVKSEFAFAKIISSVPNTIDSIQHRWHRKGVRRDERFH
mmetsp:Transcript_4646/g.9527  ORF Transcript_4646/g.9527 Transcript_4646/m.9527 type:complete len:248 (-) Transcript_4646:181-924(-)